MIQEYLLNDSGEIKSLKAYKPKGIKKRVFSADKGKCWYVQFSLDGENQRIAKHLSAIDEYVKSKFHVTTLKDGCSAYFNKRLYPLVSGFEYSLRELLYLTSAINSDEKSSSNIADLESQDFGQIFTMLFVDPDFMGKVKDNIKSRNRDDFSKARVIAAIESIDENTLWDKLLGKDSVPTLRDNFYDVRDYRNCVMHSRHLSWEKYKAILSLYNTINNELNKAIHDIEVVESQAPSRPTFNQTLDDALRWQERFCGITDASKPGFVQMQQLSDAWGSAGLSVPYYAGLMNKPFDQLNQPIMSYQMNPGLTNIQDYFQNYTKPDFGVSPTIKSIHDIVGTCALPKTEVSLELSGLRQKGASLLPQNESTITGEPEDESKKSNKDDKDGGVN